MIEKEDYSHIYLGIGEFFMLESINTQLSEKTPDYLPEEILEGSVVQFIPITEAQLNGETSSPAEPYNHEQNRERLQHLGEAYKRRLKPGEIGVRAVWSEPNESKSGAVRRKEYVTVAHDTHCQLEILNPKSADPSFVFYPCNPVAYPDQTWWGLKNTPDKQPRPNGADTSYIEASAKYHDQKTFLNFEEVFAAPPEALVITASELKKRMLDKNERQLVDAQAIAAVAKYLFTQETEQLEQNAQATVAVERPKHPYHPVSVPTQETNPWFDIDVAGQTLPTDIFATQAIYVGEKRELINPTTDETITIQVTEKANAITPEERYVITLQSELSPNHYLDPKKVAIGGGVEKDETATQAIEREEGEETGKKGEHIHLGGKVHRADILRCSTDVFITLNPQNAKEDFSPDESEKSVLHHYSITEVKHQIVSGKITDAATITALLKTVIYLESIPPQIPEADRIELIKKEKPQASNEKMLNLISKRMTDPKYDSLRSTLSRIPELGLIQKVESGPEFTVEGAQFAQLMKDGSKVILENSTSFNEYREMMSLFLEIIESSAIYKVLRMNKEQLDQIRTIYSGIISDTINLFQNIRDNEFKAIETENVKSMKAEAQSKASKAGSMHAAEIVQILEPTSTPELARRRVEEIRNTSTVQDLYKITAEVLGYSERAFPKNGVTVLENLLAQKTNNQDGGEVLKYIQYLPDSDVEKLAEIILRSSNAPYETSVKLSDKTRLAVLDGIHLSWAASRGLLSPEKLDAKQYTPLPALLLQKYQERIQELSANRTEISPDMIDQAILVAVIELMKDLIYLEI